MSKSVLFVSISVVVMEADIENPLNLLHSESESDRRDKLSGVC